MPDGAVTGWLFGKLPAHGDFVARGLDVATRDRLDHWLSGEMARGRAAWGDAFDHRYESAPVWHFVDESGVTGWTGGILCASTDRVGRQFPLVFAVPAADSASAVAASAGCLDLVGQAFAQGWDADRLIHAPLVPADLPWRPERPSWALVGEDGPAVEYEGRTPEGVIERMLEMAA